MHRIQAVADKSGKRTGKYIADLIANNCFRHTGITCADPMAMDWAKSRPTASTAEETCTEQQEIHWCSGATSVHSEGKTRLGVFTDGSALATATDWLAHGGWGMFITAGSSMNAGGHLLGHPVTSYRAEVRAMVAAVVRARVPVCIVSDCSSAVTTLQRMRADGGNKQVWPANDDCLDFWEIISEHLLKWPPGTHDAQWVPGHLDADEKKLQRQQFLEAGGPLEWIEGNIQADILAGKGSCLLAPPPELLTRERLALATTRNFQRMAVHILAIFRGHLKEGNEDGHEAEWEDAYLGFNDETPDAWQLALESELLDEVMAADALQNGPH